jgi:hypothetical protein
MAATGDYEQDVLELGERAADCLFAEELGRSYPELRARVRSLILNWYGYAAVQTPALAENWAPRIGEDGMWRMPGEAART